jgi:hypothetical protein
MIQRNSCVMHVNISYFGNYPGGGVKTLRILTLRHRPYNLIFKCVLTVNNTSVVQSLFRRIKVNIRVYSFI